MVLTKRSAATGDELMEPFQDRVLDAFDVIAMLCKPVKEGGPYKIARVIHLSHVYYNNASSLENKQNITSLTNSAHKVTIKRDVKMRENHDIRDLQVCKSAVFMWTLTVEIRMLYLICSNLAFAVPLGNSIFYTLVIKRVSYQL